MQSDRQTAQENEQEMSLCERYWTENSHGEKGKGVDGSVLPPEWWLNVQESNGGIIQVHFFSWTYNEVNYLITQGGW